jgi:hypothetical protein
VRREAKRVTMLQDAVVRLRALPPTALLTVEQLSAALGLQGGKRWPAGLTALGLPAIRLGARGATRFSVGQVRAHAAAALTAEDREKGSEKGSDGEGEADTARTRDEIFAPPLTALLTPQQCARWFQVSKSAFYRIANVPSITLGDRTSRYSVEQVLRRLQRRAR